ncbi:hypothetical protein GUJ93_ZPchr0013g34921 [Zizania palustris]|uniref:4-hydroxyphenylacetaldehyde oxime monooxygenase n=1 Tax=Zizania palustris TaxID=103762 RepID=A0A8J5X0B9_ZIZPA|nr:hypothetical protein GUJ93_ZPchr0013g34921 [Zizania palustris]
MAPIPLPLQWQLTAAAATLLLALVASILLSGRCSSKKAGGLKLPPGPVRVPILGNLLQVGPLPHRSFRELARRHGPVMLLQLGTVPTVVVSSADAARDVMKAHDADCCSRPVSPGPKRLSYDLKDVAFAPYDDYWREMRKLFIVELLSMRRVNAAWYARQEQVENLVRNLTLAGPKPVALNEHIYGLADGIIGTVAFGNVYGTERFAHKKHFQNVLDEAMDMMASFSAEDFFPNAAGRLIDRLTGIIARRERIFHDLDAYFEMVIDKHLDPARDKPENGGDLVDVLIGIWKDHRGTLRFSRDHVKAIILDTFLGGIDTSSVTMLWTMSELIRAPRVLTKVQGEIRAVVGDKERVQPDDMPKLTYLKMVVKETLRLHPPATLLLPRETMRDAKIGGYDVPAKTRIFVNAWAIGRDAASWDEPEEFNPDRFETKEVDFNGAHFELVPFGAGRRICPGLAMGAANVEFTLANLLHCFDWALPDGVGVKDVSMKEAGGLIFHRKTPLVLVPSAYAYRRGHN